jgi:hypothetical protein
MPQSIEVKRVRVDRGTLCGDRVLFAIFIPDDEDRPTAPFLVESSLQGNQMKLIRPL